MKVISCYLREQQRYTKGELCELLALSKEKISGFISRLRDYGIIKIVAANNETKELSDLTEDELEFYTSVLPEGEYYYKFQYVGIVVIGNRVLKIYPKYIISSAVSEEEFKQVIQVIAKYARKNEHILTTYTGEGTDKSYNVLRLILQLLYDYYEYGSYCSSDEIINRNGEGIIDWERTIEENQVFFKAGRPYYTEFVTRRAVDDNASYIKLLHELVLTDCSRQLEKAGLDVIFGFEAINLSEAALEDFGDKEYILGRLLQELNIQFNTRKQILLKTLYTYLLEDKAIVNDNYEVSFYGTTAYAMVWQDVCAEVFNNKLFTRLDSLGLNQPLAEGFVPGDKLIELIERPIWQGKDFKHTAKATLIPDIITLTKYRGEDLFAILDAKYYLLQMEKDKQLAGNPGIGDVSKQYLYQLAYHDFVKAHAIKHIFNCFLMPVEGREIIAKGQVFLSMFSCMHLENIQIRLLPAGLMYEKYLAGGYLEIKLLLECAS